MTKRFNTLIPSIFLLTIVCAGGIFLKLYSNLNHFIIAGGVLFAYAGVCGAVICYCFEINRLSAIILALTTISMTIGTGILLTTQIAALNIPINLGECLPYLCVSLCIAGMMWLFLGKRNRDEV